jgi:hypothetical protein
MDYKLEFLQILTLKLFKNGLILIKRAIKGHFKGAEFFCSEAEYFVYLAGLSWKELTTLKNTERRARARKRSLKPTSSIYTSTTYIVQCTIYVLLYSWSGGKNFPCPVHYTWLDVH